MCALTFGIILHMHVNTAIQEVTSAAFESRSREFQDGFLYST